MSPPLHADSTDPDPTAMWPQPNGANTPTSKSPIEDGSGRDADEQTRRRKSATQVSRGIVNLTPEQLKRKRENDKLAQREARKRTRSRIEELENHVQELESQTLYQDLQSARHQKDAVQAENEELRRRLASIVATVQPILDSPGFAAGDNSSLDSADVKGHAADLRSQLARLSNSVPPSPASQSDHFNHHAYSNCSTSGQTLRKSSSVEPTAAISTNYPYSPASADEAPLTNAMQSYRPACHSDATPPTQGGKEWTISGALDSQKRSLMNNLDLTGNGERLGLHFLLGSSHQRVPRINEVRNPPETSSSGAVGSLRLSQPTSLSDVSSPAHTIPVRNVDPTCTLDSILLEFLHQRQRQAAEGACSGDLVGPPYPSVSSLLNPAKGAFSHPLSKVFTDILRTFPDISSLPEQVAVLYIMFLVMRWQIYPTRENYERLPHWISPRASQIFTPHPAWMDYLPWPSMRDRMIPNYADYDFSNWFIPYTSTLSVNWPYEPTDTLLATAESDELVINPVFESHLRNLNNWSLGPAFAKDYPHLADTAKIKQDNKDPPAS